MFNVLHLNNVCNGIGFVHYGVEAGATGAAGNRDGVYVELNGDDTAAETVAHLFGNIEDKGRVHTIIKLHGHVHVVMVGLLHLVGTGDVVGLEVADAEGHQASANDVYILGAGGHILGPGAEGHQRGVVLHACVVVYGDGVAAAASCVQVGGARQSGEGRRAVDGGDTSVVVVQDDLREIDIGDGA